MHLSSEETALILVFRHMKFKDKSTLKQMADAFFEDNPAGPKLTLAFSGVGAVKLSQRQPSGNHHVSSIVGIPRRV
jgi:hypothetical protein